MTKKRNSNRIISIILMFLFTALLFPQSYNASATTTTIITTVPSINMPSSVDSGQSISASWNSISGASGYSIALLDQTTGAKVTNNTTKASYTVSANTLVAGHSYKFWVGVTNAAGTNAGSAVYFTVNKPMPIVALPRISMPSSVNADQSITASWNSISGASTYSIALLDQTTGVKITNSITKTSYTANANTLVAGHSYKFWVGVTNEAGTNAGSEAYFTVNQLPVSVTSVSLNKTTIPLNVGSSETLTATVLPSTAINKTVSWKSSNTAVATVDTNGKVTGAGVGNAIITVTTTDGNKTMTCSVTVMGRPSVTTGIASGVTVSTATLNGTLDGNGGFDVTDCGFYWGTSSSSMTNKAVLGNQGANKGSRSINIIGLIGETTYYYQMYAINAVGEVKGSTGSFKTLNIALKPTIIMTMSPNKPVYTKGETVIITGTGTNCEHMSLEINGKAVDGSIKTGNQYTYAYTFITTGKYEFKLKARNGADNDINSPVVYSDIKPVTVTLKINGIVYRKYTDKKLAVGLATVKLNNSDDPKFKTITDLNGRFSFDSVMPGSVMSVEKAGYDKIIDIQINENSNIGDIVSEICYTNPKEVYTLNGRVIGKYSEYGIGGVNVEVIDKDNTFHWFATTDANGNYEIKGVGPAIYGVTFTKAGFVDTSGKSLVTLSLNSINRNTTTSNIELIDMNNAYLITGRVTEKDSNKAIVGAVVKIVGQDKFTDKTDENGYYHIYGVSGNNPWKLDVSYPGYISKQVDAAVGLANRTVNVGMEKPIIIEGTVYEGFFVGNRSDTPITGAKIWLNDGIPTFTKTPPLKNGYYSLSNVMPSTHDIYAECKGYATTDTLEVTYHRRIDVNEKNKIFDIILMKTNNIPSYDYQQIVKDAYVSGLLTERTKVEFKKNVTRSEFVELAVKLYEKLTGKAAGTSSGFSDDKSVSTSKAKAIGIVTGDGNMFKPNDLITRNDAAVIIYRVITKAIPGVSGKGSKMTFSDMTSSTGEVRDAVAFLSENGIINGTGENKFSPNSNASKEQAITIVLRAFEKRNKYSSKSQLDQRLIDTNNILYELKNVDYFNQQNEFTKFIENIAKDAVENGYFNFVNLLADPKLSNVTNVYEPVNNVMSDVFIDFAKERAEFYFEKDSEAKKKVEAFDQKVNNAQKLTSFTIAGRELFPVLKINLNNDNILALKKLLLEDNLSLYNLGGNSDRMKIRYSKYLENVNIDSIKELKKIANNKKYDFVKKSKELLNMNISQKTNKLGILNDSEIGKIGLFDGIMHGLNIGCISIDSIINAYSISEINEQALSDLIILRQSVADSRIRGKADEAITKIKTNIITNVCNNIAEGLLDEYWLDFIGLGSNPVVLSVQIGSYISDLSMGSSTVFENDKKVLACWYIMKSNIANINTEIRKFDKLNATNSDIDSLLKDIMNHTSLVSLGSGYTIKIADALKNGLLEKIFNITNKDYEKNMNNFIDVLTKEQSMYKEQLNKVYGIFRSK
jgi:uncharacterized protein YjdB